MKKTPPFTNLLMALCVFCVMKTHAQAPNGYHLWLGYDRIEEDAQLNEYQETAASIYFVPQSEILETAKGELKNGLAQMLNRPQVFSDVVNATTSMMIAKKADLDQKVWGDITADYARIGAEGFIIKDIRLNGKSVLLLTANEDIGILYGVFKVLRLMQIRQNLTGLHLVDAPKIQLRMLNHWDNLDRTIERGYAGFSLWNWQKLPEFIDRRYIDYARANASIGINATVLTNVNANALVLTPAYLDKVAALAKVFRPYGIRVYLTARFSAPMEIGGLPTADPLDEKVGQWWQAKAKEIYDRIPDFGGFLVKANSEGQPGPQNYGRNHVDGANMLAKAVAPFQGNVIWRAFVYSEQDPTDRAKQAYDEFVPYDGQFLDNVLVQVKNGPIDFQPREPFHPLFGAMPKTPLMVEFQITQEYLGFGAHLVYLPILFKEVLDADTYREGKGLYRCQGGRRKSPQAQNNGHCRRGQHRQRPELDGTPLCPGQLVRVWSFGLESRAPSRGHSGRMAKGHLCERFRFFKIDERVAGHFQGGARELYESPGPSPFVRHRAPLWPWPLGKRFEPARVEPYLLPQGR